jgi:hypothetical protein
LFIRTEVNFANQDQNGILHEPELRLIVVDDVAPTVNPVALYSTNADPRVAGTNDSIRMIIQSDEPVSYSLITGTNDRFYISDSHDADVNKVVIARGRTRPSDRPTSETWSGNNSAFTVYSYDSTIVKISVEDTKEGFFYFENLTATDRAGNTSNSFSSGDFANKIWIDPVAPTVTSSGFSTNTGSGAVRSSGLLTSDDIPLYEVSGIIQYDFTMFEKFNPITDGEMSYKLTISASGVGSLPGGIGVKELTSGFVTVSGLADGVNLFSGLLITNDYYNGLYVLTLEMKDYVGNESTEEYLFFINNALEVVDMTVTLKPGNLHEFTVFMSTFYTRSGSSDLTGSDLTVTFNTTGGDVIVNDSQKFDIISFNTSTTEGAKLLRFNVDQEVLNVTSIKITIKASGVAKFKEFILEGPLGDGETPVEFNQSNTNQLVGY